VTYGALPSNFEIDKIRAYVHGYFVPRDADAHGYSFLASKMLRSEMTRAR
jgi:hypothetical protein